jgi:hypothetical protein
VKAQQNRQRAERGVALVIALFTLMLISVVATALILMAGTETAMKGNYKSAMHAFYDARAGLEEGRGRLWARNPNSIASCVLPGGEQMMPVGQVCYILNPSAGEVVNPVNPLDASNPYADTEYQAEWGVAVPSGPCAAIPTPPCYNTVTSNSPIASANIAGPLYKWVRITSRTEHSGKINVDGLNSDDNVNPLFYDGMQQLLSSGGQPVPGATQVLTITALAVTPYGSRRMVQYTVALAGSAAALSNFPSALTLDGNSVRFTGPSGGNGGSGTFPIVGNDINAPSGTQSGISAIGYTNSSDGTIVSSAATPSSNYMSPQNVPNVGLVSLPLLLQTPSGLQNLVQSVTQNADLVLNPPQGASADQQSLPSAMSASNPMIVVVNGDFNLTHAGGASAFTGYGLLLVTGTLHYDPDDSWYGVILVIGKGVFDGSHPGKGGQINGTVFVANTTDNSGNVLTSLGPASFSSTGGGNGIQYSSNWVKATQALLPYQVRSFREIAQTTP